MIYFIKIMNVLHIWKIFMNEYVKKNIIVIVQLN